MLNKTSLRKKYLQLRNEQAPAFFPSANDKITTKVLHFINQSNLRTVGIYLSQNNEVSTIQIIEFCLATGIEVYVPQIVNPQTSQMEFKRICNLDQDLEPSAFFKLNQPKSNCLTLSKPNNLEVLFVPVVAFDNKLHRIGMGGGYYDRWVLNNGFSNPLVGLGWSFQKTTQIIETESHDVSLTYCFTEEEDYGFSSF